jgi:HPt (histidine-containing phosphotransfer) domain-containing protein
MPSTRSGTCRPPHPTGPLRQLFYESNNELVATLIAALRAGDLETAIRNAHAIKGAGLLAGFPALAEAAAEVETSLQSARFDHAGAAIGRAKQLLSWREDADLVPSLHA